MNTKSIHVVHIIPTLSFGGAERCVVDLINNCDPERFRFSVIVFFTKTELAKQIQRPDVKIIVVDKNGQFSLGLFSAVENVLRKLQPDIVHTHLFGADVWGRVAAKRLGVPVVTTEHNLNYDEGWLKAGIKRWLRNRSDYYTASSEAVRQYAIKRYSIDKNRIAVVRCAVDLARFKNVPAPRWVEPVQLLILGRLVKQKGHAVLLQALGGLKEFPWRLTILGNGKLREFLHDMVKTAGLNDRVSFEPAVVDVVPALVPADLIVMPSLWEGLGIVVMEAMAAERMVIVSRTGGIPELVEDKRTGFLVPPGDPKALAKQLEHCLTHRAECLQVAQQARKYAIENFGVEKMVKKYEEIYRDICNS